jgi:predicted Zn-dependent protease with MMP-like domain
MVPLDTRPATGAARTVAAMVDVSAARFEELVADALDSLPDELGRAMENVAVVVEDEPPEEGLLGLYEGTPLTEREDYGGLAVPDLITIYRRPICALARDEDEVVDEVRTTVIHEVAHHFGIDDERLDELGWA